MNQIKNESIVKTESFKRLQHKEVQFDNEFYEIAICGYGNKLSEVFLIHQLVPRPLSGSEYDVSSKMKYSKVQDKPKFVQRALNYAKTLEALINVELSQIK